MTGSSGGGGGGGGTAGGLQVIGITMAAVGAYYAALSQKYQLQSQSMSLGFARDMSALNARSAEFQAQDILRSGALEAGRATMASGQQRDAIALQQAASGTSIGQGSNAEVMASVEILRQIEAIQIDRNTVRQAMSARTRAQDFRTQAAIQEASRQNLRDWAGSIDPYMAHFGTLLGGSGSVAQGWQGGTSSTAPSGGGGGGGGQGQSSAGRDYFGM